MDKPDLSAATEFLHNLETQLKTFQTSYEQEQTNITNLEKQEQDAEDSIALIEDDIHILFEDPIPDILLYRAMKADLMLTLDGLKEIQQALAAKKALVDQITEGLAKAEKGIKAMKRITERTGTVIPFKKDE